MTQGIEVLTALAFLLTGLSHLLQPRLWARFFLLMREQGEVAPFLNGLVHLPLGLLIVAFHNVWTWPQAVVTVIGWSLTLKGAICFVAPKLAMHSLANVSMERAWMFRVAGVVALGFSALVTWGGFT